MVNLDENQQRIEAIEQKIKLLVTLDVDLVRSDCRRARLYVSQTASEYFGADFAVHFCSFVINPEKWVDQGHFIGVL